MQRVEVVEAHNTDTAGSNVTEHVSRDRKCIIATMPRECLLTITTSLPANMDRLAATRGLPMLIIEVVLICCGDCTVPQHTDSMVE